MKQKKKKQKSFVVKIDKSLDRFHNQELFKEKVDASRDAIKRMGLPEIKKSESSKGPDSLNN